METPGAHKFSLRDFFYVVFKRKNQILLFFFVTVFTVALGTFLTKPTYEATSQVLVKIGKENIYMPPSSNLSPIIEWNREEQINSEIELLKGQALAEIVVNSLGPTRIYENLEKENRAPGPFTSRTQIKGSLLEKAACYLEKAASYFQNLAERGRNFLRGFRRNPRPQSSSAEEAVFNLQKALTVEGIKRSNVIQIRFNHSDPQVAATVVNTLVNSYLERRLQVHGNPQSHQFFNQQAQFLKTKLRQAEEKLETLKKRYNVTSIAEEQTLLLRQEAQLRAEHNKAISQKAETENRIHELRQQLASTPKTISQGEQIDHNPYLINTLQARLVELELREKELLAQYTENSRLVSNVRKDIQMVREKLAEHETKRYGRSSSGPNPTYLRLHEESLRNEAELEALKAKIETQELHLAGYRKKLEQLSQIEMEFKALQDELDLDREKYRLYLTKYEDSRISSAMDKEKITSVSLIETARPPTRPVSPKVTVNMLLAVLLGGCGGLGLVFLLEHLDDSLERPEDVEDALHVPVLSSIPELKQ